MRYYFKSPDILYTQTKAFSRSGKLCYLFGACTKQNALPCAPAGAQSVTTAATTKINGAIQVHEE